MPTTWTSQQILALAPDTGSAKSGQALANPRKWVTLGHSERAAWGECQGSGSKPYQTQIDLSEPAFKCSCPSRKFPCKHGLGLFLMLAGDPAALTTGEPPAWVTQWLTGRSDKAEQKVQKTEQARSAGTTDPEAQAKRLAQREAKIGAGLEELQRWLHDLMRQGLADLPSRPGSAWEAMAARMVDAQAPGAASLLRGMAGVASSGAGWQDRLLIELGRLHLLIEGWGHRQALPSPTLSDIKTALGWPVNQDEVLAETGISDTWAVVGQRTEEESRLRVQRTWLLGETTGRAALVLSFAHGTQPLDVSLVPGTRMDAEMAFFPSAAPLRALVKSRFGEPRPLAGIPLAGSIRDAQSAWAATLTANPWSERIPVTLRSVVPLWRAEAWLLRDEDRHILPFTPQGGRGWHLLALSGGHPVNLFGEWDGDTIHPLGLWTEEGLVAP